MTALYIIKCISSGHDKTKQISIKVWDELCAQATPLSIHFDSIGAGKMIS